MLEYTHEEGEFDIELMSDLGPREKEKANWRKERRYSMWWKTERCQLN